jgi:hypothetical protein
LRQGLGELGEGGGPDYHLKGTACWDFAMKQILKSGKRPQDWQTSCSIALAVNPTRPRMTPKSKAERRWQPLAPGFAFTELLVIVGITAVLLIGVAGFALFSGRSFAAIFNYVDLDDANRVAMEQLAKDLRQAKRVTAFGTNYLYLEDVDKTPLKYDYSAPERTLTRSKAGVTKTILSECDTLKFDICQRNALVGSYELSAAGATNDSAKVIDVSWVCSRTIFGKKENGETIQPTRMFVRKQGS